MPTVTKEHTPIAGRRAQKRDTSPFRLDTDFLDRYRDRHPNLGFGGLGEFVFYRTYSRLRDDGTKESFLDTLQRVVEGCYEIQRRHCSQMNIPWTRAKAQRSAHEMFQRMWDMKFLPPGRGLWGMGTPFMWERGSACLLNCAFYSTENIDRAPAEPFAYMMDMSMVGVGVGFDTRGAGKLRLSKPHDTTTTIQIDDSREGWVDSVRVLVESYTTHPELGRVSFDYSLIRKAGSIIKGFGGKASGPGALHELHEMLRSHFDRILDRLDPVLSSTDIVDLMNYLGRCVVAGNVRRSAQIAFGEPDDLAYLRMKDKTLFPQELDSHRWASNNSVYAEVGMDYSGLAQQIATNGEPGLLWLDNMRNYGRMIDGRQPGIDGRVMGGNPCLEQSLESGEACVAGSTRIQTISGCPRIADKVGKAIQIWNGQDWSWVTPRVTGINRKLYRVRLSDGSFLDCTDNHGWSVRPHGKRAYRRVRTIDLRRGDRVEPLTLGAISGRREPAAFEMGFYAGDGYRDKKKVMACVCGQKAKLANFGMKGTWYKPQCDAKYSEPYNRVNLTRHILPDQAITLRDKDAGLPDWLFELDKQSILEFLAGFVESDGACERQPRSDAYRVYGCESQMRDLQLLARRAGIDFSHVGLTARAGQVTNKGVRKRDMYCLNIPSYQCCEIPVRVKKATKIGTRYHVNPFDNSRKPIDMARKQHVVAVEELPGLHTTYCFDEPQRHQGVFGNVLTYQCNLVETFPSHHTDAADYHRTLKFAYLYAKTVTLQPTHNQETNAIALRNRRIGLSQSGIAEAFSKFGRRRVLTEFCDVGYKAICDWDKVYSDWLCIGRSIKKTSVKPSGCRPWNALTTTDRGVLTLEEIFGQSAHIVGEKWSDVSGIWATQGRLDTKTEGGVAVLTQPMSAITKTYDNGQAEVFSIKLSHNITVESTANHRWFVTAHYSRSRSTKYRYQTVNDWKRTDELVDGDILDVEPGIYAHHEHGCLEPVNSLALRMRGPVVEIRQPTYLNPDLSWLLGYLWGDGAMSPAKWRIRFSDENLPHLQKAQRILLDQFNLASTIHPASQGRNAYQLEVGNKILWHWLIKNGMFKYHEKRIDLIPLPVRQSAVEDILAFFAGLLDSDGCVVVRPSDKYIVISAADKQFAKHAQDVALALGVVLSRSHNTRGKNFQPRKSMWSLSSMKTSIPARFALLAKHSCKCQASKAVPWSHELDDARMIVGKVKQIKSLGTMPTYDVEVADTHWYYAGAVKSHNTVSLVAGVTPGIHFSIAPSRSYWRSVRVSKNSLLEKLLRQAGYKVEQDIRDKHTSVVWFGVANTSVPTTGEVSMWEQVKNACDYQRYWADNQVSCTVHFSADDRGEIAKVLTAFDDQLKGISFLPQDHGFEQAPYEPATEDEVRAYQQALKPIRWDKYITEDADASATKFCDGEACQLGK